MLVFGWSKPCFRLWTRGVPSIHNGASCIFGGTVGGTKWNFILEEAGKLVALAIKAGSQVTTDDLIGFRAFRDAVKRKASLVRGVVFA
jgi:hypothetical protein